MTPLGFSTGCLYRTGETIQQRIDKFLSMGADAIELGFATSQELFDQELTEKEIKDVKKFRFVTIHAPFKDVRYGASIQTKMIIDKLHSLCDFLPVRGIVIHPDKVDDFSVLQAARLPFLMENMDKNKHYYTLPEHFKELKEKYRFGFVLDVQHVYEHDQTMELTKEFARVMGDKLHHLHVSGQTTTEAHAPACTADNKEAIMKALRRLLGKPIILEGVLQKDCDMEGKEELAYVRAQSTPGKR